MRKLPKKLTPRMIRGQWLVWRVKVIDIGLNNNYPGNILSNLCNNAFSFDGMDCRSMEGFLQRLKQKDKCKQRLIYNMKGSKVKQQTIDTWQEKQIVWWKGCTINRQCKEFQQLIRRAYQTLFDQNERCREAVMATCDKRLRYLDDAFHKRMVITHCKNLCRGDYLIDDCSKNETSEFEGEWIEFGIYKFPDWPTVVGYLYEQNGINLTIGL